MQCPKSAVETAIRDYLAMYVSIKNEGAKSSYHTSLTSDLIMRLEKVRIDMDNNVVLVQGKRAYKIERQYDRKNKLIPKFLCKELEPKLVACAEVDAQQVSTILPTTLQFVPSL